MSKARILMTTPPLAFSGRALRSQDEEVVGGLHVLTEHQYDNVPADGRSWTRAVLPRSG
jgi:hypothetical protein